MQVTWRGAEESGTRDLVLPSWHSMYLPRLLHTHNAAHNAHATCTIFKLSSSSLAHLDGSGPPRHRPQPVAGGVPRQLHQNIDLVVPNQLRQLCANCKECEEGQSTQKCALSARTSCASPVPRQVMEGGRRAVHVLVVGANGNPSSGGVSRSTVQQAPSPLVCHSGTARHLKHMPLSHPHSPTPAPKARTCFRHARHVPPRAPRRQHLAPNLLGLAVRLCDRKREGVVRGVHAVGRRNERVVWHAPQGLACLPSHCNTPPDVPTENLLPCPPPWGRRSKQCGAHSSSSSNTSICPINACNNPHLGNAGEDDVAHALSLRPTVNKPNKSHLGHTGVDDVVHALWAVVRQRRLRKV